MACDPLIEDDFRFPRVPFNRPGLPRIAWRIGRYPDFVEAMTRHIDAEPALLEWTHRDPDDPAIALLQGAAILGDILSFYQEHYANEAYLRTAAWRQSVADLVRLAGYRLAPGIGGRATFAFEVRGTRPVALRAGFPVKADLKDVSDPAEFQTVDELSAWPHLGRFNLYRPRQYGWVIEGGQARVELAAVGGAGDSAALDAVELKKGDRLVLVPEESLLGLLFQLALGWTQNQSYEEIVVVEKVERQLGRVILTLAGNFTHGWFTHCRAFALGRSFRHFGTSAPPQFVQTSSATNPPTTTVSDTPFLRGLKNAVLYASPYISLDAQMLPLEQEVNDLAAGSSVLVTGTVVLPFAVTRTVTTVRSQPARWGNLNMPASFVRLDRALAPEWTGAFPGFAANADLRTLRLHETRGPMLQLRPLATFGGGAFANGTQALHFYGSAAQAKALAGRKLHLAHPDGRSAELVCTNDAADFAPAAPNDAAKMWPLSFDRAPAPFTRTDFDEAKPAVTVFGNLADAVQGKQEPDVALGNGDARAVFQTFPLPKAPLTYFLSNGAVPPQTPRLEVWVGGRLWSRVDAFFGRGPKDEIYIVREDAEGRSFVQFGDGETGARLPSGVKNVVARYRSGVGARGPIKPGATPSSSERPEGFDKVSLAGIVSGGTDPEDLEKAREAAPGKVQSLGRLVSLRDFETETLSVPGVVAAAAAWDLHQGVPAMILRVLLEAGREAEFADVRATLAHAQRCRGPDRFPVVVQQALLRYVFLDVRYARDPSYRAEDVDAALHAAMGLVGDAAHERSGLFGLRARRLGEREYASRIEGRLQNVAGVLWCRVSAMGRFAAGVTDTATLVLPVPPRPMSPQLPCSPRELLQLLPAHFALTAVAEASAGECA
jgi:hypothetical protein